MAELAWQNPAIEELIYGSKAREFFAHLLDGPVRHYDFTWFRPVGPGLGTPPHCDLVFMGRGTKQVFTMWVPYGLTPPELGGLMVLEGSHHQSERLRKYLQLDVDSYCSNRPGAEAQSKAEDRLWSGWLAKSPVALQKKLGGRWLTSTFQPGDILIFGMTMVHASLDNQTNRIRFSSDCRYQRADQPIDDRWIGAKPAWHSSRAKRGRIC
jgi:ectoine hydroxylase-related dioxygenase (phytanoyl-CoA dioxygenase family)